MRRDDVKAIYAEHGRRGFTQTLADLLEGLIAATEEGDHCGH